MKKRTIIIAVALILLVASITVAATNSDPLFQLGEIFRDFQNGQAQPIDGEANENLAAAYHDHQILKAELEFHKRIQMVTNGEASAELSDRQIIENMVKDIIMVEEADRLGIAATQDEVDAMIQEQKRNYEVPEVKEYLDSYCKGAEMTIDEYFSYLEQYAPTYISRQNLRTEIGNQYCEKNGLEYTNINPPQEMLDAIDAYIEELFEAHKGEIVYYIDN